MLSGSAGRWVTSTRWCVRRSTTPHSLARYRDPSPVRSPCRRSPKVVDLDRPGRRDALLLFSCDRHAAPPNPFLPYTIIRLRDRGRYTLRFDVSRPFHLGVSLHGNRIDASWTWPDLAIGLYDRLTGRGAEIVYEFQDFELLIPSSASPEASHAKWRMNGVIKIRTRDNAKA